MSYNLTLFKQLIPLYVCVGAGCIGAVLYTLRLAVRNPDVQWNRTGEISNEEFRDKQYKVYKFFLHSNVDPKSILLFLVIY